MQQWKTQERITLNLNRITFGNVTPCNLDFYRRSAVKGFIPLENCEGREKLLMLMDFWKLQGLRKLCPLSLLSYALLSITLAIKIPPPHPPASLRPFLPHSIVTTDPLASPPLHLASLLPVLLCSFSQATSGPLLSLCQRVCVVSLPLALSRFPVTLAVTSGFKVFCLLSRKCSPGVKVLKTGLVRHLSIDAHCRTQYVSLKNKSESKALEMKHKFKHTLKVKSRKSVSKVLFKKKNVIWFRSVSTVQLLWIENLPVDCCWQSEERFDF